MINLPEVCLISLICYCFCSGFSGKETNQILLWFVVNDNDQSQFVIFMKTITISMRTIHIIWICKTESGRVVSQTNGTYLEISSPVKLEYIVNQDYTVDQINTGLKSKNMLIPNGDQSVKDPNMDANVTGVNDRSKRGKSYIPDTWFLILLSPTIVNSYLGSIPVSNEPHQVSKEGKSPLISGGDSSCSWVLVRALDPV